MHESGVASGIRRIEAVTRKSAMLFYENKHELISVLSSKLNSQPSNIINKIDQILEENIQLKQIKEKMKSISYDEKINHELINGYKFFSIVYHDMEPKDLKSHAEKILKNNGLDIICVISTFNKKVSCVINLKKEVTDKLNAIDLVNIISKYVDGKPGGGRTDMAQSGGQSPGEVKKAIQSLKKAIMH